MDQLTQQQLDTFNADGFLVFEHFFEPAHNQRIKDDVDRMMNDIDAGERKAIMGYRELGMLTSDPGIVARVSDLMGGTRFTHHHIHARWQTEGEPGIPWHHDYEQLPQTNRSHLMVHVFMYLDGLNGEVGDLLVLPGSHKQTMERYAPGMFEYADLPGSITINELAPGSIVILHSAIVHARRPKPGGTSYRRYFIDTSYCQDGILWPGYGHINEINELALAQGYDREGRYAWLYDSTQFYDARKVWENLKEENVGSLALKM
jgi:ectoine hydroxylase-related dioxygenase (phytanoyl-CoA dioxygenase family)